MIIKRLGWDSQFYGINIAHLKASKNIKNLSLIKKFIHKNNIHLIQCCCDIGDTATITLLEKHGFHFVDLRVVYIADINRIKFHKRKILIANEKDIPALIKIAKCIFKNSRYYHKRIKKNKVSQFYARWTEKAVRGEFDNFCLKVVKNRTIAGFITIRMLDAKKARIGLIGVAKKYENKGIGKTLLEMLFSFLKEKRLHIIEVATQGKNLPAQNLFIKSGFKIKNIQSWYYKFTN